MNNCFIGVKSRGGVHVDINLIKYLIVASPL